MSKLKLFACCVPVKGAKKSIICDLQRLTYDSVPNSLIEFVEYYEGKTLDEIFADFKGEDRVIITEYLDFLSKKEYIFFTDIPEAYPKLDLSWDSPRLITNCIIDYSETVKDNFPKLILQLNELRCESLELRFFDVIDLEDVESLISLTRHSTLRSVSIVLKENSDLTQDKLEVFYSAHSILTNILIHSATNYFPASDKISVFFTEKNISDESHCGIIDAYNFSVNISAFTEAQNYNSCLNRKISIDRLGNIKNCPSMKFIHGHINSSKLIDVVNNPEFQKKWNIKKDEISGCKDCEFRYICTDCRAYLENLNDEYSKPLKCNYDPINGAFKNK